jgi:hypothetical protein
LPTNLILGGLTYDASPPSAEELHDVVKGLKAGKAGGPDGTVADMFKALSPENLTLLHTYIRLVANLRTPGFISRCPRRPHL